MSFPFLFGVMFGDIGHGYINKAKSFSFVFRFVLMMAGLYLTLFNHKIEKSDSVLKVLLVARHMILLMGFCAFYNGWIYNDFLSLSINMFGSCYHLVDGQMVPKDPNVHCTYPIGIDPVWSVTSNELTFVNSYKMKV